MVYIIFFAVVGTLFYFMISDGCYQFKEHKDPWDLFPRYKRLPTQPPPLPPEC